MKKAKNNAKEKTRGPGRESMGRIYLIFIILFLFGAGILIKTAHIQIIEGPGLNHRAREMEYRYFETEALRGNIFAADGSLLAATIPIFDIRFDAASPYISDQLYNDSISHLAYYLSKMFGDRTNWGYKQYLINARKKGNRYLLIQRNVTYEQLSEINKFPILNRGKYKGGLIAERKIKREYPYGILAKRTIGYSRINEKDSVLVGLEGYFDQYLKGTPGTELRQRMANKSWRPIYSESDVEPQNGKDIITTIDTYFQDVAENALMKQLYKHNAKKGTVVLMEVETGQIKAIANLVHNARDNTYNETYNLAVGESFEPGSTFKLASVMVAQEDGILSKIDSVEIGDGWTMFHGKTMKDSHLIDADGWLTPEECLVYSSNVGISKIIYDHYTGKEWQFYRGLNKIFPMEPTGIEIFGEIKPAIRKPDNRNWSKVTLPWMSIGYEITVTPLQMLTFYNAVANNGKMVKPYLVQSISEAGRVIEKFEPEVIKKSICSEKTLALMQKYLTGVVEKGTASNIKNDIYKIAGKTGTAKVNKDGVYISKYNASFAGYFPADNPKYSCIVVVYEPGEGGFYATQVAAPVFKEIADIVYATRRNIYPGTKPTLNSMIAREAVTSKKQELYTAQGINMAGLINGETSLQSFEAFASQKKVPDVKGMGAKDAVFLLENMGFVVKIVGRGLVKKQSLSPGTTFNKGNHIYLTMSI
jgi:cell division protein FtsI (penicillin-binding protein 3)